MSNTLDIGSKISFLRKHKKWSQAILAEKITASREIIGKYERNESLPSIVMTVKIAKVFGVTVDFLTGAEEDISSSDKKLTDRIQNIEKMDEETKNVLFNVIDTYIQHFKTKQALSNEKKAPKSTG